MTQPLKVSISLPKKDLARYVIAQINNKFPDHRVVCLDDVMGVIDRVLERLEYCFSKIDNTYFFDGSRVIFNHLHGDQYAMWLYLLSNEIFRQGGDPVICSKIFLLNKSLSACDIFYEISLPEIFLLVHPVGTVLGRGKYSDYFVAYQRVGVGSNHDVYPQFGEHVTLRPGAAVLGKSRIGNYCQIATESLVLDSDVPDNTLFIGRPENIQMKSNTAPYKIWRTT